ncbi:MAG TPA: Clp protease N-terminal domain-containing protein [Gaiellaceae bacterium]
MFERFTERARQVVVLAQDEARALGHNYIGTEHLLLGLIREQKGIAARVLDSIGLTIDDGRADVLRIVGKGDEVTSGNIPFTPRAKKVLELSLREGLSLGHNYIGTEHILLGLAREGEGVASHILLDHGAGSEDVQNEVLRLLGGSPPAEKWVGYGPRMHPHRGRTILVGSSMLLLGGAFLLGALVLGLGLLLGWLIWG